MKIKGPVGDPNAKRDGGKPPATNKPADVVVLRELLSVNGYGKPSKSGKVDATLLKCIKLAEIHMGGGRDKDVVIDPDDMVFKSLVKTYNRKKKEEKAKIYKVTVGGKDCFVDEKQYAKVKASLLNNLGRLARTFREQHKHNHAVWKEYNDIARMEKGMLQQSIFVTSSILGGVTSIDPKKIGAQSTAVSAFEAAVKAKDLKKVEKTLPPAEKATREAYAEVQRFLSEFIKGAGRGATAMTITSSTGFIIVGAMAAPMLVTGAALSTAQAAVATGTGVAFLESSATTFGRYTSGEKVTAWGAASTILIDTVVGGLTAGIGAKLPTKYIDDVAGVMLKKVTAKFPSLSPKIAESLIKNYLATGVAESYKEAAAQATKMCGDMLKSGKTPKKQDFLNALTEVLFKGLTAGMLKNVAKYEAKVAYKTKETLTEQMIPAALAKYAKSDTLGKTMRAKVIKGVLSKFSENMSKIAFNKVVAEAEPGTTVATMLSQAEAYLKRDPSLQKKVDAAVLEILKKENALA